ncbi:PKD-like family lipoprotein [Niabella sp. CJ426]|uniref:PKD-like family lipoprotein n=1 Tax=Niabella sp. CJ426 TaxID=3393740 RepID=UPI003D0398DD
MKNSVINVKYSGSILLLICIALISCFKDKGNYDYNAINDIAIVNADTMVFNAKENLFIRPVLVQELANNEDRLKYEWVLNAMASNSANATRVLATTRDINIPMPLTAQKDYYQLDYKVMDTVTGVTYRKRISVLIATDYQVGWALLERGAANADISFISIPGNKVYHNAFSAINPGKVLPNTAHSLFLYNIPKGSSGNVSYQAQTVTAVLFDNDGYLLNYQTLGVLANYSSFFTAPLSIIKPEYIQKLDAWSSSNDLITINNGLLYRRYYSKGMLSFSVPAHTTSDLKPYYLAPGGEPTGYFYDTLNNRFLNGYGGVLTPLTYNSFSGDGFDAGNVDKRFVTMGQSSNNTVAILKDAEGLYMYTITSSPKKLTKIAGPAGIENSPGFQFVQIVPLMYYAVNNQIYVYDIQAQTHRVVYSFPPNENVTALKLQDDYTLLAATYNNSGSVYFLSLEGTGNVSGGAYTKKYDGFGRIVSMVHTESK